MIKSARVGARRATRAHYDDLTDRFVIDLDNGVTVAVPRAAIAPLAQAESRLLAQLVLHNGGTEIAWPDLDCSFSVPEMLPVLLGF